MNATKVSLLVGAEMRKVGSSRSRSTSKSRLQHILSRLPAEFHPFPWRHPPIPAHSFRGISFKESEPSTIISTPKLDILAIPFSPASFTPPLPPASLVVDCSPLFRSPLSLALCPSPPHCSSPTLFASWPQTPQNQSAHPAHINPHRH